MAVYDSCAWHLFSLAKCIVEIMNFLKMRSDIKKKM